MIEIIVLILVSLLFLLVLVVVSRAVIRQHSIIGNPPVPVLVFILAKTLVLINLLFLVLRGLNISTGRLFPETIYADYPALALLISGMVVIFLSTVRLDKDLIFGLSSSDAHKLQTKGVYSISRHPFYLGFLLILLSSCLLNPHVINVVSFIGAWLLHHLIMIKEEEHLTAQYGDEYRQYAKRVARYISLK